MDARRLVSWKWVRVLPVLVATGIGGYALGMWSAGGVGGTVVQAANPPVNACGCYRDTTGACYCGKKGKCDCPGDCEPKGCEEKRAKEMEKEVVAETKRARDAEKKQKDEAEEKRKKAEAAANAEAAAAEGGGGDTSEGGDEAEDALDAKKKGKLKGKTGPTPGKKSKDAKKASEGESSAP
jgi:hypothetical protein